MSDLPAIAFMGSDAIALPLLEALKSSPHADLVGIVSQPDRPQGWGKKLQPNPISGWALNNGLTLHRPEKPEGALTKWLVKENVQLVLVMAYGHLLRKDLLNTPPLGMVNFHASLLPKYRGASPIETAVACGEKETGVSLMRIVKKMDAGAVCDLEKVEISPEDTGGSLREKLAAACVPLIQRNLEALFSGTVTFTEQDDTAGTYCRKLNKQDGNIDFSASADELAARIQGLSPWPGCRILHNDTVIKVFGAWPECDGSSGMPGEIVSADKEGVRISCSAGVLCIKELQRSGGKRLPAPDFLRGYPLEKGDVLTSQPMAQLLRS